MVVWVKPTGHPHDQVVGGPVQTREGQARAGAPSQVPPAGVT